MRRLVYEKYENRDYKFRTWDYHLMRMMEPQTIRELIKQPSYNLDNIFMQYTGMKSMGGREIYEGDIVKLMDFADKVLFEVIFNGGSYLFKQISPKDEDYHIEFFRNMDSCEIELVGNIYEDEDLCAK